MKVQMLDRYEKKRIVAKCYMNKLKFKLLLPGMECDDGVIYENEREDRIIVLLFHKNYAKLAQI